MASDSFPLDVSFGGGSCIFDGQRKSISEIKDNCAIFFDANVLLAPYSLSDKSFDQIKSTYSLIADQNRLHIPSQVAAEYAKNRASKIGDILKTVNDQISKLQSPLAKKYSILKKIGHYKTALDIVSKIEKNNRELSGHLKKVADEVRGWDIDDPVLEMYRSVLSGKIVELSSEEKEKLPNEIKYRYKHGIPPGYKDDGKSDGGSGDLIIWKTVIEVCRSKNKDAIFVTLDQKPDWWSQAANAPLFPRSELIHEFYLATSGKTIHLQLFSDFLNSFGADEAVIEQVKNVEVSKAEQNVSESRFHDLDSYDIPKAAIKYMGLKEQEEKLAKHIRGRKFAYKRCTDRGDMVNAEYHNSVIEDYRKQLRVVRQEISQLEDKYPSMIKNGSLDIELMQFA